MIVNYIELRGPVAAEGEAWPASVFTGLQDLTGTGGLSDSADGDAEALLAPTRRFAGPLSLNQISRRKAELDAAFAAVEDSFGRGGLEPVIDTLAIELATIQGGV